MTALESSIPSHSKTDCTSEHIKKHGTATFHGKAERYMNAISALLLKKTQAGKRNAKGFRTPKGFALIGPEVAQSLERKLPKRLGVAVKPVIPAPRT